MAPAPTDYMYLGLVIFLFCGQFVAIQTIFLDVNKLHICVYSIDINIFVSLSV